MSIATATRRYAGRKGQWYLTHGADAADKHGLNKARRDLDKALCIEGMELGPDPEPTYFAVEDVVYDDDDWFPGYFTKAAFDDYNLAAEYASLYGGWVIETDRDEFEYFEIDRKQWEWRLRRECYA